MHQSSSPSDLGQAPIEGCPKAEALEIFGQRDLVQRLVKAWAEGQALQTWIVQRTEDWEEMKGNWMIFKRRRVQ